MPASHLTAFVYSVNSFSVHYHLSNYEMCAMGYLKRYRTESWLRATILESDYPHLNSVPAIYLLPNGKQVTHSVLQFLHLWNEKNLVTTSWAVKILNTLMIWKLLGCPKHCRYNVSISFTLYSQVTGHRSSEGWEGDKPLHNSPADRISRGTICWGQGSGKHYKGGSLWAELCGLSLGWIQHAMGYTIFRVMLAKYQSSCPENLRSVGTWRPSWLFPFMVQTHRKRSQFKDTQVVIYLTNQSLVLWMFTKNLLCARH